MIRTSLLLGLAGIYALPLSLPAQDYKTLLDIPEGATLINLSVTERTEVDQDLLTTRLTYQVENESPELLQEEINTVMKQALKAAKKVKSVKTSTQNYRVYEYKPSRYKNKPHSKKIWRGEQSLVIKSKTPSDLLQLAGDLQAMGLTMASLNYEVSPELAEKTQNNMLEAVLEKLRAKARRSAQALGKKNVHLLQVNINNNGHLYSPRPMMARMKSKMMADSMSAPVAAPGQSNITLSVSAQALLTP